MVESAQAEVEDKERSELEMKVEMARELMREELERLRCSEDTLQSR